MTATFSSPDGAVFSVAASFFSGLTGRVLLDNDLPLHALVIGFSSSSTYISMNFAVNGTPTNTFTMQAFSGGVGGSLVGTVITTGSIPAGFTFPEGRITFSGLAFDTVRLTSNAQDFAIDNVLLTPEPASVGFVFLGLTASMALARRRKRI